MARTGAERMAALRAKKALEAKMPPMLTLLQAANTEKPELEPIEASNDGYSLIFDSVFCDWLSISHPLREYHPIINDGRVFKILEDGTTDWVNECWKTLHCASSDTTLRIKCDGEKVMLTGNIGRYGQDNNLCGYSVAECCQLWQDVLDKYYPTIGKLFLPDIEMLNRITGEVEHSGTRITRCDLTSNFDTDNFASLSAMLMSHQIGQHPPRSGKYGPMWGYEAKRAGWFKAKVYDKTCELEGRRTPATGATTARFEIQLGSEYLRRNNLHTISGWQGDNEMSNKTTTFENVIYGKFADQVFKEQATAENWLQIPPRLRHYAIMWRDGHSLRSQCGSDATFYRVRKQLLDYGVDCSQPCNIVTLVRRVEVVRIKPLNSRRSSEQFQQHRRNLSAILDGGIDRSHEAAIVENHKFDELKKSQAA